MVNGTTTPQPEEVRLRLDDLAIPGRQAGERRRLRRGRARVSSPGGRVHEVGEAADEGGAGLELVHEAGRQLDVQHRAGKDGQPRQEILERDVAPAEGQCRSPMPNAIRSSGV